MKKKMLFMAAIAGLISLGSCVKDDVSGSVEAVRNAKANELNAKANEHNANAALANANAALTNAKQSAEVALAQANAALAQARAEAAQLDTQLQKERYAAELEAAVANFEAQTATNKANAQRAANDLAAALRVASTADLDFISNLIGKYNQAYANFVSAQQSVINAKSQLAQAQISAEYAVKTNAVAIQDKIDDIAKYKAIVEALEAIEQEGTTDDELDIKKATIAAQIVNAAAGYDPENEAAQEFVAAAKALKKASDAYDAFVTNPVAINDVWNSAADAAVGSGTPAVAADGYNDDDFDHTFFGTIGKLNQLINPRRNAAAGQDITGGLPGVPVAAGALILPAGTPVVWANDYIEEVGTPEDIYGIPGVGFKAYNSVVVADANAAIYGTPLWTPAYSASPKASATAWQKSNFSIKQFRVNERAKLEADKYFEDYPVATKTALDNAKTALDEAIDYLGKSSDTATTKTTLPGNKGALTLYAEKAKAAAAKTTANDKLEAEMTALTNAEKALAAAYASTAGTRANDIIQAKIAIGRALENIYGSNAYVIAGVPTDAQADTYVNIAGGGTYFADIAANKEYSKIKELVDALITPAPAPAPGSTDFTYTKGTAKAAQGRDVQKNYQADLLKAQGVEKNAEFNINGGTKYDVDPTSGTFGTQAGAVVIGQVASIANQKDAIATVFQPAYDDAAADVAEYKALVEAVDFDKYNTIVDNLKDAIDAYNAAYKAAMAETASVTDLQDEYDALPATTQDIDDQIVAAKQALAQAEEDLANAGYDPALAGPTAADQPTINVWDPTAPGWVDAVTGEVHNGAYVAAAVNMSWDEIIDYWKNEVTKAENNLLVATTELLAAQKAIEDSGYEIDLDGDDEPAEEPAEDPSEEPAEGGEETPAEGEGEAEGGEEA
jgi:hypothetical protein